MRTIQRVSESIAKLPGDCNIALTESGNIAEGSVCHGMVIMETLHLKPKYDGGSFPHKDEDVAHVRV